MSVRCRRVDLQTVCPFDLMILAVKAEPTLVAGPKYCPRINLTSGKVPKYHPIIPAKLTYVAYVGGTTGHNGLWHLTIGHIHRITG